MNTNKKVLGRSCIGLGITSIIYYIALVSFAGKVSFAGIWIIIALILIILGILVAKNKTYIFNWIPIKVRNILIIFLSILLIGFFIH